ncbi:trypsin-like peptidase domain-containing protein [Streptomyces sp. NPDC101115]|uniref:S1C family serine protease n=1 Tax=Streptomyces sp. NPDC101115 TaxID=3366106 RepID=UPI0037FB017A
MKNGKPTWWSRPSSTPTTPEAPAGPPEPADDADFTLAAPATPAPVPESPAAPEPGPVPVSAPERGPVPVSAPEPAGPEAGAASEPAPAAPLAEPAPEPVRAPEPAPAPAHGPAPAPEPASESAPAPEPVAAQVPQTAQQPLHAPDPYRTPPYGEPGPWAPAPPVQRPVPAPPMGQGPAPIPAPASHPAPAPMQPAPPMTPVTPAYDPWGTQPLAAEGKPPRKPRRGLAFVGALAFALVTGVIGGGVGAYVERNGGLTSVELPQAGAEDTDRAPGSVAAVAAKALPSVVTIHVSGSGSSGTGTGFVLDTRGHILTNNHVVDAAASSGEISVTFSNGESARAKLIGRDTGYDLAVIQVRGVSGLKPLPLGNSDSVRVGDPVVAIGAPFDLSNTVTSGIISAKERPITAGGEKGDGSDVSYVDALQTDAPINPGNSGGPLVDSQARVIGINSAIRAAGNGSTGEGGGQSGSIGLGFAIPINQGKRVAEELINTGKATHPVIGVSLDMAYTGDGARVGDKGKGGTASVTPGGPAAKAGIHPGDVITKVDGQRVHSGEELIVKIRAHRPGDRLKLTLTRDGKEQTKTLTLGSSTGA